MNSGNINIGLSERRINFLKRMFLKHLSPETKRRAKCYWYDELITKAPYLEFTEEEQKVIDQITPITKKINLKEFIMEMADLKKFAKEAGLSIKEIKGMNEDELIIAIISSVDSEKNYSDEFTEWYDELDEDYFNEADSVDEEEEEEEVEESDEDKKNLIEAVEDCKKVSELKEILDSEEFGEIFEDIDPDEFKLTSKLKAAMIEAVENYFNGEKEEEEVEENESDNDELIEAIEKCKTLKKLQTIAEENEIFEDIKFKTGRGRGVKERDLDEVKEEMINLLSGEVEEEEEEEEEKPTAKPDKKGKAGNKPAIDMSNSPIDFDVNDFDVEELMEEVGKLPFLRLKTFAKAIGLTIKPGVKQDQIIELVEEKLQAIADGEVEKEKPEKKEKGKTGRKAKEVVKEEEEEEEEEEEVEITEELIKDAIDGDDTEMLAEICESLGINLKPIQKKSAKQMGVLALRQFGRVHGKTKELEKEDKTIDKEERQSVYQVIEEMVLAEEEEDDIIEAVTPAFKERGKKASYIKKRVAQMIEIVKLDNDLE